MMAHRKPIPVDARDIAERMRAVGIALISLGTRLRIAEGIVRDLADLDVWGHDPIRVARLVRRAVDARR